MYESFSPGVPANTGVDVTVGGTLDETLISRSFRRLKQ